MIDTGIPAKATGDGGNARLSEQEFTMLKNEIDTIKSDAETGVWERRRWSEDVRYCRWDGQSDDGRKHSGSMEGRPAFPFEGAMDSRIRLADMIINENGMVEVAAAQRAHMKVRGIEDTDHAKAAKVQTMLKWIIRNQLGRAYRRELEKLAQYVEGDAPAVAVMGVFWYQEAALRNRTITIDDIVLEFSRMFEGQLIQEDLEDLVDLLTNPVREEDAVAFLRELIPILRESRAKKVLKSWRETGTAEFPEPYVRINCPRVEAFRLFDDLFIPSNTGPLQRARAIFHRQFFSEAEVRAKKLTDGWSQEFINQLIGLGDYDGKGLEGKTAFPETYEARRIDGSTLTVALRTIDDFKGLYEVVTPYWRAVNEDGVPGIYTTTMNPNVTVPAVEKELLDYDHGDYPFIEFTREILTQRLLDSRSVPELVMSDQAQEKILDDTYADHAQLTLPPIFTPKNRTDIPLVIGPLKQIRRSRQTDYEWMKLPDYPRTTEQQRREIQRRVHRYFGCYDQEVPPELITLHMQNRADRFLWSLCDVLAMVIKLSIQYFTDQQLTRIVGGDGLPIAKTVDEIQGFYDLELDFDVRNLDKEYILKLAETVAQYVLPMDTTQTVMRDRLVNLIFSAISPTWAETTLRPVEEANFEEAKDEESNYAKIFAGVEPPMMEEGQNFRLRLAVLEEIINKNPTSVPNMSEVSRAILERRMEHLRFMVQQEENAQIGRVGAAPALEA